MGFLSGRINFERYSIDSQALPSFGPEQIERLQRFAIGQVETSATDGVDVGFLAGEHLFDVDFQLEKNVIGETLHFGLRIDTNKVPAALRRAWLQIELAALTADSPSGRPTKAQRQEAQEAVEARCEEEVQSGKYRRMQQFPVLWDARDSILYFGASSAAAGEQCAALFSQAFDLSLERMTAGKIAQRWASASGCNKALFEASPSNFHNNDASDQIVWLNGQSGNLDWLGNEFLLWLWWYLETQSDVIPLADDSDVTGMLVRTLSLECPRGESGKETITADAPVQLPEALQAIRSGKLPRKTGLILVRNGAQFDLTLQAESFSVGGAKIQVEDEGASGRGALEDRIENLRLLSETLDLLFAAFCTRRLDQGWTAQLQQMQQWLQGDKTLSKLPAA